LGIDDYRGGVIVGADETDVLVGWEKRSASNVLELIFKVERFLQRNQYVLFGDFSVARSVN